MNFPDREVTAYEVVQDARDTLLELLNTQNDVKIREAKKHYVRALLQLLDILNSSKL